MSSTSTARSRRTARRAASLLGTLIIAFALVLSTRNSEARGAPNWLSNLMRVVTRRDALPPIAGDTVVVFGPKVLSLGAATSGTFVERFTVTTPNTGGYLLRVTNGAGGASGVTGGSIRLNGAEVVGATDFAAMGASGVRDVPVLVAAADTIVATLTGPAGAAISVAVLTLPDARFTVFGPKQYERSNGAPVTVTSTFALPAGAKSPSFLCIRNGEPDGSRRNSSSRVILNGVEIVGPSDLNQQVSGFLRTVTFQATNTLQVEMRGSPGSRLTVCGLATDSLAPKLTITAPTPSLITRQTAIDAVGVVVEQTAVKITVNGQLASVTPGTAGQTSFTARVALATEGANQILFSAIDAAGNRTDSTRTVIRDTQAPTVTLNSLPDSATVRADSSLLVTGTITDATTVTANVNGQPLAIDSASHTFSQRITLASGMNFITITATDAAGNATSVVRQITVDNTPPTLTVTGPAEGLITKDVVAHVTGTAMGTSAVTVTVNGSAATLGAAGAFTADVSIAEGTNTMTVVATNAAGLSVTATRQVVRDTQAPALGWTAPLDSAITKENSIAASGTITDATTTTLTVNGANVPVNGTTKAYATPVALPSDGSASITVVATDAAGNVTTATRTVTRDATAPVITVQSPDSGAVTQSATVAVSGSVSDLTTSTLTVNGTAFVIAADGGFSGTVAVTAGANTLAFVARDAAGNETQLTRTLTRDNEAPVVQVASPSDQVLVKTVTVTVRGTITDASVVTATLNGAPLTIAADRTYQSTIALSEGMNTITLVATDAAGNATTVTRTVTLDTTAPVLTVTTPTDGTTVPDATTTVAGTATDQSAVRVTVNGAAAVLGSGGAFSTPVALATGANTIAVIATDSAGNSTTVTRSVTRQAAVDPNLPPDPRTVAPALNRTVATTQSAASTFLYTGSNPIQTGVAPTTIVAARVSTLRGRVLTAAGVALPGAAITVLDHPEFGGTKSRADGWYDLVVNGGGKVTLAFGKAGYLGAQRMATAPRQDYGKVDDVVLLKPDTAVTVVQFGAASVAQTARASVNTDADGTRRATMIIDAGTVATIRLPDGSTQAAPSLSIRVTEFTVGPRGRAAMPAPLPAASAYTYAAEPTADEALAVGGTVTLSKPVSAYVENFLGFPVGTKVPLGTYDRVAALWVPEPDGQVVKVLSVSGGIATVDANGDGIADSESALTALGFSVAEREQLAVTYQPGATLMRTQLRSFRPFDPNFPFRILGVDPVASAEPGCASAKRDIIKCDVRVATQAVDVPGTPLSLAYSSARAAGAADRSLQIPLTGATMPAGLLGLYVGVLVAGQATELELPATANASYAYTWDGTDAYGRPVQGNPTAVVQIGYRFPLQYQGPAARGQSFGLACDAASCTIPQNTPGATDRFSGWRVSTTTTKLGGIDAKAQGLGGFDFNVHHVYDPIARVLYLGDGTTRVADAITPVITTVAGRGLCGLAENGVAATKSCLIYPAGAFSVLAMPDGGFLVPDQWQVRRVRPDGIIEGFAGLNQSPSDFQTGNDRSHNPDGTIVGEGGPATRSYIVAPGAIALGPDGTVYIADGMLSRIVRVAPNGILTRVLGKESGPWVADGMAATVAKLDQVRAMAVGLDGALYFATRNDVNRIYRLGADSVLQVIAGTGIGGTTGDGGPARQARIGDVTSLAVGADGSLYLGQDDIYTGSARRVRRITPDGVIRTVVGGGGTGADQATPALEFGFGRVAAIAVGPDGTLYVANDDQIEQVGTDGIVRRFAGENLFNQGDKANRFGGDGGSARRAYVNTVLGMSVASDNSVLIADYRNGRIRRVAPPMPGFSGAAFIIASEDGSEFYSFDASGRHLITKDVRTSRGLYTFLYDGAGRLINVVDQSSRATVVERDVAGNPVAIIAPSGLRTALRLDPAFNLTRVAGLGSDSASFQYAAAGLISGLSASGRILDAATYDGSGRTLSKTDPDGGFTSLVATEGATQSSVVITPAAGAVQPSIVYQHLPTAARQTTTTLYPGVTITETLSPDGQRTTTYPDGSRIIELETGDARLGMQSPVGETIELTPAGLARTTRTRRGTEGEDPTNIFDVFAQIDSTSINGRVSTVRTDRSEASATRTSAAGRKIAVEYDGQGRATSLTIDGLAPLTTEFDEAGRVGTVTIGARTSVFSYDAIDRVTDIKDPAGGIDRLTYDASGRVARRTYSGGKFIDLRYDALGNLLAVTPSGASSSTYGVNAAGRLESFTAPSAADGAGPLRAAYDAVGRTTQIVRPDSTVITSTYAASNPDMLITTSRGDSTTYAFSRTSLNLMSIAFNRGSSLAFTYDGFLRKGVTWTGRVSGATSYLYDPDFRIKEERINGADPIAFGYDADGELSTAGALTISRDARNTNANLLTVGNITTRVERSTYGEPDSVITSIGGNELYKAQYTVDALGRIRTKRETIQGAISAYAYAYDSSAQLTDVTRDGSPVEHYEYDANGNRVRSVSAAGVVTATIGAQDRLIAYGNATFTYGRNGEVARRASGADTTRYRYTAWNQLQEASLADATRISYVYDGEGRRVGKEVNGVLTKQWLYRGDVIVAELGGDGATINRFIHGERANVPEYMSRAGVSYRIILDERGSVRLVVNAATGAVAQRMSYDSFGQVTENTNPDFQPFGFGGGVYDSHTKLVQFGLRDYDASTGRWTTQDPMLFGGGDWNLYRYAAADPVNVLDVTGESILAADMLNQERELAKLEAKGATQSLARRKELRRLLCKNGATMLDRYSRLKGKLERFQMHHVLQDATMLAFKGYTSGAGIALPLGTYFPGSPHKLANATQAALKNAKVPGMYVAYEALWAAGCDAASIEKIMKVVEREMDSKDIKLPF